MRFLIKFFMPSADKIADTAADKIAEAINNCGKADIIAKYGTLACDITAVQQFVTDVLKDGKISDEEKKQISDKLKPLVQYLVEMMI